MGLHIVITDKGIADKLGISVEEFDRLLREKAARGEETKQPPKEFVYSHLNHGSGICPLCAPWLGVRTTAKGEHENTEGRLVYEDGVPVVPQHPLCKCYLAPAWLDAFETGPAEHLDHLEWMSGLPKKKLQKIIGKVRFELVKSGKLTLQQLFDSDTFTLLSLRRLGFDERGVPLA